MLTNNEVITQCFIRHLHKPRLKSDSNIDLAKTFERRKPKKLQSQERVLYYLDQGDDTSDVMRLKCGLNLYTLYLSFTDMGFCRFF